MAKKRNEEEIAATIRELPLEPPANAVEVLQVRGMLKKERLVYSCGHINDSVTHKKRKMVKVFCTACGGEDYLEYVSLGSGCSKGGSLYTYGFIDPVDHSVKKDGSTCLCPCCGVGLEALHTSHVSDSCEIDRAFCVSVHNVRNHLCLLSWTIGKYVNKKREVFYRRDLWEGDLIIDRSLVRVTGYQRFMSSVSFYGNWVPRSQGIDGIGECTRSEILNFSKKDIESTDSPYCALYEYIRSAAGMNRYPGVYLQLWCKYPHVENLIRSGFGKLVNSILEDALEPTGSYYSRKIFRVSSTYKYIRWKSKKPLDMLGFDKSEVWILKTYNLDLLSLYAWIRDEYGIRLDKEILDAVESCFGVWSVRSLFKDECRFYDFDIPIVRTLHYLIKQIQILPKAQGDRIGPGLLRDYWNYVYREYGTMQRSELYPKNLVRAHDAFLRKTKERAEAELIEKFNVRFQDLSRFSYESPSLGLMIRPCETQEEMIFEGKSLSHCVGGYRHVHANGGTSIFFIRRVSEKEVPFYTLEYKDGRIIQDHGYKNCLQTEEILAFEREWLSHIKKIKEQKGKSNGKTITSYEQLGAGA